MISAFYGQHSVMAAWIKPLILIIYKLHRLVFQFVTPSKEIYTSDLERTNCLDCLYFVCLQKEQIRFQLVLLCFLPTFSWLNSVNINSVLSPQHTRTRTCTYLHELCHGRVELVGLCTWDAIPLFGCTYVKVIDRCEVDVLPVPAKRGP